MSMDYGSWIMDHERMARYGKAKGRDGGSERRFRDGRMRHMEREKMVGKGGERGAKMKSCSFSAEAVENPLPWMGRIVRCIIRLYS